MATDKDDRINFRISHEDKVRLQKAADSLHIPLSTLLMLGGIILPNLFVGALGVEVGNLLYERFFKSDEERRLSDEAKKMDF